MSKRFGQYDGEEGKKELLKWAMRFLCYEYVKCEEDEMDRYTKFILTLIAILLALLE